MFDAEHVILPLQYNPWRHQQHLPTRQRQLLPVGGTKHTTTIHRISSLKTTPSSSNLPFPVCFLNLPGNSFAVFSDEVFWSFGVHCFQSELRSFQRVCCHQYSTQRKPVSTKTIITIVMLWRQHLLCIYKLTLSVCRLQFHRHQYSQFEVVIENRASQCRLQGRLPGGRHCRGHGQLSQTTRHSS